MFGCEQASNKKSAKTKTSKTLALNIECPELGACSDIKKISPEEYASLLRKNSLNAEIGTKTVEAQTEVDYFYDANDKKFKCEVSYDLERLLLHKTKDLYYIQETNSNAKVTSGPKECEEILTLEYKDYNKTILVKEDNPEHRLANFYITDENKHKYQNVNIYSLKYNGKEAYFVDSGKKVTEDGIEYSYQYLAYQQEPPFSSIVFDETQSKEIDEGFYKLKKNIETTYNNTVGDIDVLAIHPDDFDDRSDYPGEKRPYISKTDPCNVEGACTNIKYITFEEAEKLLEKSSFYNLPSVGDKVTKKGVRNEYTSVAEGEHSSLCRIEYIETQEVLKVFKNAYEVKVTKDVTKLVPDSKECQEQVEYSLSGYSQPQFYTFENYDHIYSHLPDTRNTKAVLVLTMNYLGKKVIKISGRNLRTSLYDADGNKNKGIVSYLVLLDLNGNLLNGKIHHEEKVSYENTEKSLFEDIAEHIVK